MLNNPLIQTSLMPVQYFMYSPSLSFKVNLGLTLQRPGGHRCPISPKFQFYFKKGSSKKFPISAVPMSR